MSFVHLHVHTEYSTDAISKIRDLITRASELNMPGLAITDHGTISGVPEFFSIAEKYPDIKPIAGCEFWVGDKGSQRSNHLILLAKNLIGYKNLVKLVTFAHTEGMYYKPRITKEVLVAHHEGLICTSACIGGEIPQAILADDMENALYGAKFYQWLFGDDFYLEVSLHRNSGPIKLASKDDRKVYRKQNRELVRLQKKANEGIFEIARELGVKVIVTNDVHFVNRADGIVHDVKLAISHGKKVADKDRLRYSHLEYLKTEDEMRRLFPEHPEVIDNTLEVLEKVERYSIWRDIEMPKVSERPEAELIEMVYAGAEKRFGDVSEAQRARLEQELEVILGKGVAGYFLMLKDLVDWIRSKGWMVGPGRGSAAGSLVNYCLGITDIDSMKYGLLFERFYSPEQISLPDIDLDLEPEAEAHIKDYLRERFGKECVSGIITFGKYGPIGALKKAGKAMGISADKMNRLCRKLNTYWPKVLPWNLKNNTEVQQAYEKGSDAFREAYNAAIRLSDVIEDEGIHTCGWLIAPSAIGDILPVQLQEGLMEGDYTLNAMYEARYAEDMILKLDILSFDVLKVIKDSLATIEEQDGILIEPGDIPLDDEPTLSLFANGDVAGITMMGSQTIADYLKQLGPVSFNDLVAMYAMTRPGPMEWIPNFIARKRGEEEVEYEIPVVEEILGETYGIIVYQEQVMQICQRLASFSPERSDKLRKAMGKRKETVLRELYVEFLNGACRNGYDSLAAGRIWNQLRDVSSYVFNKSHAVCYTWLSYQLAWIKAHYPKVFYRVYLNAYRLDKEEVDDIIADAGKHDVYMIPPDKSRSAKWEALD